MWDQPYCAALLVCTKRSITQLLPSEPVELLPYKTSSVFMGIVARWRRMFINKAAWVQTLQEIVVGSLAFAATYLDLKDDNLWFVPRKKNCGVCVIASAVKSPGPACHGWRLPASYTSYDHLGSLH